MHQADPKREVPVITIKFLLVAIAFVAGIFIFAALAHEAIAENEAAFDMKVAGYFQAHLSARLVSIMRFITFFGSTEFLLPAYAALVIILLITHRRKDALNIAIIAIVSTLLLFGLKQYYKRIRPDLPLLRSLKTFSFPSGHALCSFIFCSILGYLVFKSNLGRFQKWISAILLLIFSLLIGLSRVILRMHFATDVIAGFCLGISWVILSFWVMKKTEQKKNDVSRAFNS
jgi:membrane-associated phospholipid phosphatase